MTRKVYKKELFSCAQCPNFKPSWLQWFLHFCLPWDIPGSCAEAQCYIINTRGPIPATCPLDNTP